MKDFIRNCFISGMAGGLLSLIASGVAGRAEHGRGKETLPIHAVSHIAWDDRPESHRGHKPHNAVVGTALHQGACVFWAVFYEALFGRRAERSFGAGLAGGAAIATAAYVTDYYIVSDRFKPGFEAHLSDRSLFGIYAALAVGLAAAARLRGLYNHQKENRDEGDEGRHAERRPDRMVAPE